MAVKDVFCGYDPNDPRLEALYSKGKVLQWDAATALDWAQPVDPGAPVHAAAFPVLQLPIFKRLSPSQFEHVTAEFTETIVSQFLHGEQGALMVAARLVGAAPDFEAKLYASTQTIDEARHLEVFARYLKRVGKIRPITKSLQKFLEAILGVDDWVKMLLGMQIVVEGAALSSFHSYRKNSRDPLLSGLLDGVIRDEARHVGFGHLYVTSALAPLTDDEKEALAEFAFDAIARFSMTRTEGLKQMTTAFHNVGVSVEDVMKSAAAAQLAGDAAVGSDAVRGGIADVIVPMLRRVGALTPGVEEKLRVARLASHEPSPLLAQLTEMLEADS